jgi:hypothetical protein
MLGVDVQDRAEQRHEDVRDGEVATDVAHLSAVDHADDVATNRRRHLTQERNPRTHLPLRDLATQPGVLPRRGRIGYEHPLPLSTERPS